MAGIQSSPGRGRYLVSSASGAKLSTFLSEVGTQPEVKLVEKIGPSEAPHTAVFDMSHEKAAQLEQSFAGVGELKIEPDQRVKMMDKPAASQ